MLYRVFLTVLLAAAAGSASAQDFAPIGAGFAGPVWPATPAQYAEPLPAPKKAHFETDYVGPRLLDTISSRAESALDARLERELERESPAGEPSQRELVYAN